MSAFLVWVEMDETRLFNLEKGISSPKVMHRHMSKHHSGREAENHKDANKFFQEIAKEIQGAKELLLVGPGLAKKHFARYLEEHHSPLAKAVVGMEDCDHQSDRELLALSRKFFRYFDTYGKAPAGV